MEAIFPLLIGTAVIFTTEKGGLDTAIKSNDVSFAVPENEIN